MKRRVAHERISSDAILLPSSVENELKLDGTARKISRRRGGRGNEVEEAVQSEDEKDEAKKETGDDSNDFHVSVVSLMI